MRGPARGRSSHRAARVPRPGKRAALTRLGAARASWVPAADALNSTGAPLASFAGGVAASASPCSLSMLPLTAGYLASLEGAPSRSASIAAYCSGCALSLSATGLAFASAGSVYGSGSALPLARSFAGSVASISGLHLLQIPPIPSLTARASRFLPPLSADGVPSPSSSSSWLLKALAAGSVASFSASPCSTPLLASLLAFVASSAEPFRGALLMLCYGFGFVLPLAALASLTSASSHLLPLKPLTKNIAPIAGCLLLAGGSYTLSESALTLLLPSS